MHKNEIYKKNYQLSKAVALRYKHGRDKAPVVTATGQGWLADRIIALAREHRIPVYEDKPLVEVLRSLELGQRIPPDLYETVAVILALVMEIDRKQKMKQGLPPENLPVKQQKE